MKLFKKLKIKNYKILVTAVLVIGFFDLFFLSDVFNTGTASAAWYTSGGVWENRKVITVDTSKVVGSTGHTNFPMLVSFTDSDLKYTASGGAVASSTGGDILFATENGTLLSYEIEKYASTTGELIAWVKIPFLSSTTTPTIYMYYSNASASNNQNPSGVWDTDYKGVFHLPNGTTLGTNDSTSNGFNGTNYSVAAIAGQIGGGGDFNGTDAYVDIHNVAFTSGTVTFSTWIRPDALAAYRGFIFNRNGGAVHGMNINSDGTKLGYHWNDSVVTYGWNDGPILSTNKWQYIVVTVNNGSAVAYLGADGSVASSTASYFDQARTFSLLEIGRDSFSGRNFNGIMDEVRVSTAIRSPSWVGTEYNNQSSPATFYTVSSQQTKSTWYDSPWTYRKPLVIDHNKVSGSSALTNFPVLVSITDNDLKFTGSGGRVASSTGADILFTASDGLTKLDHEIEYYSSTTGQLIAWVRIPSLSPTADTNLYMYFGNTAAADQQNVTGTWNANYKGVWHLKDGTTLATTDSTGAYNGTNVGATPVAGKIDGAASFSIDQITTSYNIALGDFTACVWFNPTADSAFQRIVDKNYATGFWIGQGGGTAYWGAGVRQSGDPYGTYVTLNPYNSWHMLCVERSGSTATVTADGSNTASANVGSTEMSTGDMYIGSSNGSGNYFAGSIDEVRISNIARGADWIKTEYNNQYSPSTFIGVGAMQVSSRAGAGVSLSSRTTTPDTWYSSVWGYRRKISVDPKSVASTTGANIVDFPMLVSSTDPDFKYTGSGGRVASSTGGDILFTNSSGTLLSYEIEKYASTTGEVVAWVKIPFLSSTTTTSIYMYYGNASASNNQNPTGVWDSNYKGVWHLKETSGQHADSTGVNNSTSVAATPQGSAIGKIDGADAFDGSDDVITIADNSSLEGMSAITISAWINHSNMGADPYQRIVDKTYGEAYAFYITGTSIGAFITTTGSGGGTSDWYSNEFAKGITNGELQLLTFVWDSATAQANVYLNGVAGTAQARDGDAVGTGTGTFKIGDNADGSRSFIGIIDEMRVSSVVRSVDWIKTEYKNQSAPSSFYSMGGAEGLSGRANSAGTATPAVKVRGGVKFR